MNHIQRSHSLPTSPPDPETMFEELVWQEWEKVGFIDYIKSQCLNLDSRTRHLSSELDKADSFTNPFAFLDDYEESLKGLIKAGERLREEVYHRMDQITEAQRNWNHEQSLMESRG